MRLIRFLLFTMLALSVAATTVALTDKGVERQVAATPNATTPCLGTSHVGPYKHVIVWMLENHSLSTSRGHMPYLDSLANKCAYYTHDTRQFHPSLPNYLAMTSGSNQGVTDDEAPSKHPLSANSIFQQLGTNWGSYHDGMQANCALVNGGSHYIVHHNPATYFTPVRTACKTRNVPMTKLGTDLASTFPPFALVVPNNCHNGHPNSCSGSKVTDLFALDKQADDFLKANLPTILNSPTYAAGDTLIVITWDEGKGGGQTVYTVAVAPSANGQVLATAITGYSWLKYAQNAAGVACLKNACTAPTVVGPGL